MRYLSFLMLDEEDLLRRSRKADLLYGQVHLERSVLFNPNRAMGLLEQLHVRGMREGLSSRERLHVLNTMMDLSGTQQVRQPHNYH